MLNAVLLLLLAKAAETTRNADVSQIVLVEQTLCKELVTEQDTEPALVIQAQGLGIAAPGDHALILLAEGVL